MAAVHRVREAGLQMRYLATPEIAQEWPAHSVLLADAEQRRPPLRASLVGDRTTLSSQMSTRENFPGR